MVLEKLSNSLKSTLSKIAKSLFVDEKLINELTQDIQRALLSADVNVNLVFQLTKKIKERALNEKSIKNISQKEFLIKIVYEELTNFLGKEKSEIIIERKKPFIIMMIGLFGSGKCVHPESLIPLTSGETISAENLYAKYEDKQKEFLDDAEIINIENEDLFVPSFNPQTLKVENKKVTHLWKLKGKELLEINLDNGNDFSVKVTPEHPFFVLKNGRVVKIKAEELTEDDFVAIPKGYEIKGQQQELFSELKNLDLDIKHKIDTSKLNIKKISKELKFNRNYCQLTADLKKGITPIFLLQDYNKGPIVIKSRNAEKFILFPNNLTTELAEFLGYVIGDGHLGKNYIEITNEDQEVIDRVSYLSTNLFNLGVYIKKDPRTIKTVHIIISSLTLVEILNKVFKIPIGKKGKHLRVPTLIARSSNEVIASFLRAYCDCDASPGENREIELSSESQELIRDLVYLLNRFGIISNISKKYVNGVPYWRVHIRARYAEIYANRIGFIIKHKKERVANYSLIGNLQGCGKQDMLPLGKTIQELRRTLGFSIGEIQEYVNSYGLYEKTGLISRESLAGVIALYILKKKGNFFLILNQFEGKSEGKFTDAFINGFKNILRSENLIQEANGQVLLTEKARLYLSTIGTRQDLLESFKLLISSDVCWVRVKKVENIGKVDFVYDLTVEDNHSFIADNVIVHNTTSIAKLANYYKKRDLKVATLGLDVHRPAAPEQLKQLSDQIKIPCYIDEKEINPIKIYKKFEKEFKNYDILIVDTAGRDALSQDLINELEKLYNLIHPDENLLVISADIGQAAQYQSETFHKAAHITGIIVTKMDGTAKGGGALTGAATTGAKIKFIGTGEKVNDFEIFNPPGFVSRLLGMGDIESLLEKAQEAISQEDAKNLEKKLLKGEFNLIDLYEQMEAMKKMGPISKITEMIPGFSQLKLPKDMLQVQEEKLKHWKFALDSMTKEELERPDEVINAERMKRISNGSGIPISEIRDLLKQYKQAKKMMKMLKGQNPEKLMKKFKGKIPGF